MFLVDRSRKGEAGRGSAFAPVHLLVLQTMRRYVGSETELADVTGESHDVALDIRL